MKKKTARRTPARQIGKLQLAPSRDLLHDVRELIVQAREQTARAVNSALAALYWQIGKRIREDVLQNKRADYGEQTVATIDQ
jgi:hypothetical protein